MTTDDRYARPGISAAARAAMARLGDELQAAAPHIANVLDAADLGDRATTRHAATLDDWLPDPAVVAHARYVLDVLATEDDALAVIPIYMPGKERSWFSFDGQQVVTLPAVLVGVNSFDAPGGGPLPDVHTVQSQASRLAYRAMYLAGHTPAEGGGTAGYAVVSRYEHPGGHVPVWEEILDLATLDRFAADLDRLEAGQ